jgi:spore germination cell wall hydrolase CwlJ-like protein
MKNYIPYIFFSCISMLNADFDSVPDKEVIAATLILEAGGERSSGAMEAVYEVIHNRAQNRNRSEREIVLQRLQFSCWNNVERRMNLLEHAKRHRRWNEALRIVNSAPTNLTGGADHYHATFVNPSWNRNMTKTTQIGNHLFFRSR